MTKLRKPLHQFLGLTQAIICVAAVYCGLGLIADKTGNMMKVSAFLPQIIEKYNGYAVPDSGAMLGLRQFWASLMNSLFKFEDFLKPGVYLIVIIGLSSLLGAFFTFKNKRFAPVSGVVTGALLLAWVVNAFNAIGSEAMKNYYESLKYNIQNHEYSPSNVGFVPFRMYLYAAVAVLQIVLAVVIFINERVLEDDIIEVTEEPAELEPQ